MQAINDDGLKQGNTAKSEELWMDLKDILEVEGGGT